MEEEKRFLSVADELKEKGFVTLSGKVNAKYFYERTYQGAAG